MILNDFIIIQFFTKWIFWKHFAASLLDIFFIFAFCSAVITVTIIIRKSVRPVSKVTLFWNESTVPQFVKNKSIEDGLFGFWRQVSFIIISEMVTKVTNIIQVFFWHFAIKILQN